DEDKETFTMHPETKAVDASTLLFVLLQFLDKHDPKTPGIIANTAKKLITDTSLVFRYVCDDGLPGRDGAFILCSFWLISAWAIIEDTDRALELFEDFGGYLSRTGLISEELDPSNHDYRGNLPQAFSHLGYIMSAYYLDRYLSRKNR
ncbi:MAG: glycoside hydrolase family 15 protein, partial [Spirochaetia bacterium]